MRRVAILQSNYVPWRGYFDLMDDADVFIVYDEVQYTKNDWRNRNKLKTRQGTGWLTVPVRRDGLDTRIDEARIDWTGDWTGRHRSQLTDSYRDAPHWEPVAGEFLAIIEKRHERLSALNLDLLRWAAARLGIATELITSGTLPGGEGKTGRLVALVKAAGGTSYLSGPAAESYLDLDAFTRAGIAVEYKSYDYAPYPQLWGPFEGAVSILDLLLNTGPEARDHLKSRTANRRA